MGGRQEDIFEIFQNGHIFLKFLFLKNIKKKKRLRGAGEEREMKPEWIGGLRGMRPDDLADRL